MRTYALGNKASWLSIFIPVAGSNPASCPNLITEEGIMEDVQQKLIDMAKALLEIPGVKEATVKKEQKIGDIEEAMTVKVSFR